ncbi:MAG: serine/threonine-protein phosphatase, partial [Anaerolineae bacterium]
MIRTDRAHLHVATRTHPGVADRNNEDRYAVTSYRVSAEDPTPVVFAVLADGIGGHRAGEVAAEMAVNYISQKVAESDTSHPVQTLQEAIQTASRAIASQSASVGAQRGMGATCACVWVIGERLYTASVGDSRIYLLRGEDIHQLTTDHTWVQEALERGIITPEQVKGHPNQHVIRRYLGSPEPPEVDFRLRLQADEEDAQALANQGLPLLPGDTLLLCSDGLTDQVKAPEIARIVQSSPTLDAAAQALIDLACERGGRDNITVVLLGVPAHTRPLPSKTKPSASRPWLPWVVGAVLLALALAVLTAALGWYLLSTKTGGGE